MGFKLGGSWRQFGSGSSGAPAQTNPYGGTPAGGNVGGFGSGMQWDENRWQGAMGALGRRASGQDSVARQQSALAVDQGQNAIASQLASGGYNPAVQRAGSQAMSEMGQQVAGQTAIAAAQERQAAEQLYVNAMMQYLAAGMSRDQAAAAASLKVQQMQQTEQQNALNRQHQMGMLGQTQQYDWMKTLYGAALEQQAGQKQAKAVTGY